MPLPQIAVQIALSAEASKESRPLREQLEAALISACSDTVVVAECVDADSSTEPVAVALVSFGERHVRVEVGTKTARGDQWSARDLAFAAKDAPVERWRAAGYAVGSLVGALVDFDRTEDERRSPAAEKDRSNGAPSASTSGAAPAPPSSAPGAGTSDAPTRPSSTPSSNGPNAPAQAAAAAANADAARESPTMGKPAARRSPVFWLEAGALGGPGLESDEPRFGAVVRASRAFGHAFATVSGSYSEGAEDARGLGANWFSAGIGGGYSATVARSVTVDARAEAVLERFGVTLDAPPAVRSDRASHWLGGIRAGADAALDVLDSVSFLLGAEATVRLATTEVALQNDVVATAPAIDYSAIAGIRFTWR